MKSNSRINVSVGIFAHNEGNNLASAIKSVLKSKLDLVRIEQIIIVSSGSQDATNTIAATYMKLDKRIRVLTQKNKMGKALAVNVFITQAKAPILITMSGDLKLHPGAVEALGKAFLNENVGMAGAHPIPQFRNDGKINREVELLWRLHHEISLIRPKCGEVVAFRNVVRRIPANTAVDEANIEVLLTLLGFEVKYISNAIVYNRGPKNFAEYLKQRRRVQAGHQWVMEKYNYKVVTMESRQLVKIVSNHLYREPKDLKPMLQLILMELGARFIGNLDYYLMGKNPYNWKMISR